MKTNNPAMQISTAVDICIAFFRDDEKLNELTPDDRVEIFCGILTGRSDLTGGLLNGILGDYCKEGVRVVDEGDDRFLDI